MIKSRQNIKPFFQGMATLDRSLDRLASPIPRPNFFGVVASPLPCCFFRGWGVTVNLKESQSVLSVCRVPSISSFLNFFFLVLVFPLAQFLYPFGVRLAPSFSVGDSAGAFFGVPSFIVGALVKHKTQYSINLREIFGFPVGK